MKYFTFCFNILFKTQFKTIYKIIFCYVNFIKPKPNYIFIGFMEK